MCRAKISLSLAPSISLLMAFFTLAVGAVTAPSVHAQTFTVLHSFKSGANDGQDPLYGRLMLDDKGNMYGTTVLGGSGPCSGGCGTVFKLSPIGKFTVLYSFGANATDGKYPYGSLVRDAAGNFYGTTSGGGTSGAACNNYGCGTVFMLDSTRQETVMYNFSGGVDGATPYDGLLRDSGGNLYGTTYLGGAYNWGTVFKVDKSGNETVLHNFDGATGDGGAPVGGLIADSAGTLYGTTQGGGTSGCLPGFDLGCGTVYKITPSGSETVLHKFSYTGAGGWWPGDDRLLLDKAGNLYGTAQGGRQGSGIGAIFKLDTAGTASVLHAFAGGAGGGNPWAGLIADSAGNLYGTTVEGGGSACYQGCGIVFKLGSDGVFTVLHSFTGGADGFWPWGGLALDQSGNLYGMAEAGGLGDGTIFKITP